MADNVEVREALAEFTAATGWFTADRNIHDGKASIDLTAAQLRVLSRAVRVRDAALDFAGNVVDVASGEK